MSHSEPDPESRVKAAVIVAHPDDETLWAGGLILSRPAWNFHVAALCRGRDADRAPRFRRALKALGASGSIGDLDDGPEQRPLPDGAVREAVLSLLPRKRFDLVLTHGLEGEYTRHLRHEEVSRAVAYLWKAGRLEAGALWMFAYEDAGGSHDPRAAEDADRTEVLADGLWRHKHRIMTEIYGFAPDSWEERTTPRIEAFRRFGSAAELEERAIRRGVES
jgi:LmbE family N-acetylglucosaminyl deacetylase